MMSVFVFVFSKNCVARKKDKRFVKDVLGSEFHKKIVEKIY